MPELPEVEVIRRGLHPLVTGRTITALRSSGKRLRRPIPMDDLCSHLPGSTIVGIGRKAKYLLIHLDTSDLLIIHLGMTGRLGLFDRHAEEAVHDHLFLTLDDGREIRYNDTRRFGIVHFITQAERKEAEALFFHTTGPEPFSDEVHNGYLLERAKNSRQAVKTFIMNNGVLTGVGNIYANESLFAAGIHPKTPAGQLTLKKWQCLLDAIRKTLENAIACGGSTISDYVNASGESGYFQISFRVYGKQREPCPLCTTPIEKSVIGGRASYFCPHCQKLQSKSG